MVIRFGAIGDVVLCSPVFRCLKEQVEGAEVFLGHNLSGLGEHHILVYGTIFITNNFASLFRFN